MFRFGNLHFLIYCLKQAFYSIDAKYVIRVKSRNLRITASIYDIFQFIFKKKRKKLLNLPFSLFYFEIKRAKRFVKVHVMLIYLSLEGQSWYTKMSSNFFYLFISYNNSNSRHLSYSFLLIKKKKNRKK